MTQSNTTHFSRGPNQGPSRRDGPIRWALNALRLSKDAGSAIALQDREGTIFVCVRKGENTSWGPYQKFMTQAQLQGWIRDGGFPRGSGNPAQR